MSFKIENQQIAGVSVAELKEAYGLPLFVYDEALMTEQFERLSKAYNGVDLQLNYACKALTNINIIKHFKKLGSGLDCVSIQEVELGLKAGFHPDKIHFTPSCVSFDEIKAAVELKVKITLDSISLLEKFGNKYGKTYPICIRFNPNVMGGGNANISVGHENSKFGIDIRQLEEVKTVVDKHDIVIEGLHMHTGSDILSPEPFIKSAQVLMKAALQFADLEYIDLGSGFKVAYSPEDKATDVDELGQEVTHLFNSFCKDYGKKLALILEPGKFLVSEAGYFLANVNVVKPTPSRTFVGLDTGMNHLIRPMFYEAYHHITNVSNSNGELQKYTVVGYICETDTFAENRELNEIREGDILCFHNAGAYVYQMSSHYNSRFKPAEVLIREGKPYLIRKRETMEDILRNQIVL